MVKTSTVLILHLGICLNVVAQSPQPPKLGTIFISGWIPESTVNGDIGKPWLALEQRGHEFRLREIKSTQLLVRSGYECRFEFPGWKITQALFQGVEALKPRRNISIATAPSAAWASEIPSTTPKFTARYRGSQCVIQQTARKGESWDTFTFDFSFNGATQPIHEGTADWGFHRWSVRFIGDLDGDGKPDILLSMSGPKDGELTILFLSSLAKPGELVAKAAEYYLSE